MAFEQPVLVEELGELAHAGAELFERVEALDPEDLCLERLQELLDDAVGLGLVVRAVRATAAFTWVAVVVGAPTTVLLLVQAATGSTDLQPYSAALEAILYFYAAGALIAHLVADARVTRDDLFAVGATFTLVAWAFAYTYLVCQAIDPGSFTAAVRPHAQRTWMELLFLSFTTLTSTGLSDIVPVEPFARALVMIEELAGLAYVAMLVSRLVALTVMRRKP